MSESLEASSNTLFGARAAVPLVGAFLVCVAGVSAYSLWDTSRRGEVEKFSHNTAVEDSHYFELPTPAPANPVPVLTWEGRAMVPVKYETEKIPDTTMRPVYHDASTGLTLYRPEKKEQTYVKALPGEYIELKAR
jgi:hypothetical protein